MDEADAISNSLLKIIKPKQKGNPGCPMMAGRAEVSTPLLGSTLSGGKLCALSVKVLVQSLTYNHAQYI